MRVANDDNYLNQFFNRNDPYLASTLYAEDGGEQHYVALSGTYFQDLNASRDPAQTAQVLPRLQMERWWDVWGGQVDAGLDVTSLYRDRGDLSRRVIGSTEFRRPFWLDDGSKVTVGATGRLDFYATEGPTRDGFVTRALPEVNMLWEKPYLSPGGNHSITPLVMAAISPRGGNVGQKIPNEDSAAYELDTGNLFEASRFAGLDRVETGPRLVYGLDNRWGTADNTRWRLFVGQSLRKFDDTTLPLDGGAGTKDSDWVGQAEANPVPWLTLSSRFRLDHGSFAPRRMDSSLRLGDVKKAYVSVGHSYLDNNTDEFTSRMRLPLTEKMAFEAQSRNDLRNSKVLLAEGGLSWREDCYLLKLVVRRRGFTSGDVQPSTDYLLNVELLSLGDNEN
ncbi:MAG: LPS-assembly protein LptD [Proteobacteria bacterium]|nr:LPS-assembly protein LptD [Pseudomonadota bacterium]